MDERTADLAVSDAAAEKHPVMRRHRARHTKSRKGCYPCKSRRVKCDELQPVCGTCSSRGEPCSYPGPHIPSKTSFKSRRDKVRNSDKSLSPNAFPSSDEDSLLGLIQPLRINSTTPTTLPEQSTHGHGALAMDDLKLLQFFHMYTVKQMSFHPRRAMVWQQVIPEIGSENGYLMHLLLSLGGIHMVTQQTELGDNSNMVDLATIMEHHQRGLEGFKKEVAHISPVNAEPVFTGSMLLVGFAFASLKVPTLNSIAGPSDNMISTMADPSSTTNPLCFNWLYLNRGISSVIQYDQWYILKASRIRPMVTFSHDDESWKYLPSDAQPSRLSRCSLRLLKFAEGATQAMANIKASFHMFESTRNEPTRSDLFSGFGTPTSQSSPSMTLDWIISAHTETIETLDKLYQRILSILRCAATEKSADMEIQMEFEEAAILSWPIRLPSAFLAFLEQNESDCLHGLSLVILAHFYLVNTLVDTWFLRGSFEKEVSKINALVSTLHDSQLSMFMLWPNTVMGSSLTRML